jgi:hypothetical protein
MPDDKASFGMRYLILRSSPVLLRVEQSIQLKVEKGDFLFPPS